VVEQRGEAANDRQTQAHALFAMTLCGINLIELVEYPLAFRRRYAYAGIADVNRNKGSAAAHTKDGSAALDISKSVRHQIEQDSLEQQRIAVDPGVGRDDAQAQTPGGSDFRKRGVDTRE
jgi:hypothetical protein